MFKRLKELFSSKQIKIEAYRCDGCGGVISNFDIEQINRLGEGDICPCGYNQFRPTNPSLKEKLRIVSRYVLRGF